MKKLLLFLSFLTFNSLFLLASNKPLKFQLEFYYNDKKIDLSQVEISVKHHRSNFTVIDSMDILNRILFYDTTNANLEFEINDNVLNKIEHDSIEIKKGIGHFNLYLKYKEEKIVVEIPYYQAEKGRCIILGIIENRTNFRKKMYRKHKLLSIFLKEKESLHIKHPYLDRIDVYGSKKSDVGRYYLIRKNRHSKTNESGGCNQVIEMKLE